MSKARSPRALLSMTIGTSIGLLRCSACGGGGGANGLDRWSGRCRGWADGALDERVHDLAIANGHAQVGATTARAEVLRQARLAAVPGELIGHFCVDPGVVCVDPLLLGDGRQHEEGRHPPRGRLTKLGGELL